jgi:hypothetical protein
MNLFFNHFTEDLADLLLLSLSNTSIDFSRLSIDSDFNQENIEQEILLYILNHNKQGILVEIILNHYVGLFYNTYKYIFEVNDIEDYESALWLAKMELLNHDKLRAYIEIQAMHFKHGLSPE